MKLQCVLLLAVLVPSMAAKPPAEPKNQSVKVEEVHHLKLKAGDDEVTILTRKVEHVVGGLEGVYAAQAKSPGGPTKFAQILKPFLTEMHKVLDEVKTDKTSPDAQKVEKLKNAMASVKGLTKDMSSLTSDLHAQGEQEQESLLMGILMARKNRPESEQMQVLASKDFKDLDVVRHVLAHRDSKQNLVEQIASYIDQKSSKQVAAKGNSSVSEDMSSMKAVVQGIVTQLEGQLHKMEMHLKDQEELHKKVSKELKEEEKSKETTSHLKGTDKKKQRQAERQMKMVKRMEKKEDREYLKQHALEFQDVATMKKAIESVKKGDMKALDAAQAALARSFKSMKSSTGEFLHFLQLSTYTDSDRDGACPYCKAQCLEKCHNGGNSFMGCMTTCADVGN